LPGSRLHFLGLAQYGGEPLPVLDLQAIVEGTSSGGRHRSTIILGRGRDRTHSLVGLAVEEVLRVADLVEPASLGVESGLVAEEREIDGEALKIVNTRRLLGEDASDSEEVNG
jgi:chemotaxis signal transduction protein